MKKGEKMSEEQRLKIALSLKGHSVSKETRMKIGLKSKGRHPVSEFKKGCHAPKTAFKKGMTPWNKGKNFPLVAGANNCNWKGGITPKSRLIRSSPSYISWRIKVFERDKYTCQKCDKRGGYLEADHVKSFAVYPSLRFRVSNGRTLCRPCHITTFKQNYEERNKRRG